MTTVLHLKLHICHILERYNKFIVFAGDGMRGCTYDQTKTA